MAGDEAVKASGIKDRVLRRWIANRGDGRTRNTHLAVKGLKKVDEKFLVGGDLLRFPGDPRGSAKEVINCRCVIGYVPIDQAAPADIDDIIPPEELPPTPPPLAPKPPPKQTWTPATSIGSGRTQLLNKFGTAFVEISKEHNKRFKFGRVASKKSQLAKINLVGEELARLENVGVRPGKGIWLVDRHPSGSSFGEAFVGQHIEAGRVPGRMVAIQDPNVAKSSMDFLRTYRNKDDKPWSIWFYDQSEKKISQTFRHEIGHSWTNQEIFDNMKTALHALGGQRPDGSGLNWMKANVGEYSGHKVVEALAESFARVTGPNYKRGTLPKLIEDIVDQMIAYAEQKR